jgi:hypothetical protein
VQPCKYSFTTVCLEKALSLAATVTHLVIGTLQDVIENLAVNGDSALTRTVASVIGQEGEQEALFRHLGARRISPIEAPFTTTSSREIAFSALQQFIIPDTCPKTLNFTTFRPLILESTAVQQKDQVLDFSIDLSTPSSSWPDITLDWIQKNNASLSLAYTNQQALPILQPLQELTINGSMVAFKAFFPFSLHLLYGLTIVTLVQGHELISSVGVLNDRTLFGPALIELG